MMDGTKLWRAGVQDGMAWALANLEVAKTSTLNVPGPEAYRVAFRAGVAQVRAAYATAPQSLANGRI